MEPIDTREKLQAALAGLAVSVQSLDYRSADPEIVAVVRVLEALSVIVGGAGGEKEKELLAMQRSALAVLRGELTGSERTLVRLRGKSNVAGLVEEVATFLDSLRRYVNTKSPPDEPMRSAYTAHLVRALAMIPEVEMQDWAELHGRVFAYDEKRPLWQVKDVVTWTDGLLAHLGVPSKARYNITRAKTSMRKGRAKKRARPTNKVAC